ncbi:hypothetical protein [Vibrio alfacsensis]|uniref:hypothetical protein n=1 Tax=Vibrio alfacsensis TaxID=1074311 RepID=UPI00406965FE
MSQKTPRQAPKPPWRDLAKVAQKYNLLCLNGTLCYAKDGILAAGQSKALKVDNDHLLAGGEA